MPGLGRHPQLPELLVELLRERAHPLPDHAVVVVVHLLALGRHGSEQGAALSLIHICGVHGLVRGDQHKTAGSIFIRRLCRLICTEHVVLDGLVGAVLHEGHVLMGRRMVHDVGTVFRCV